MTIGAPVVWTMVETRAHRPTRHPSFDGVRYVVPVLDSRHANLSVEEEIAATLVAWRDGRAAASTTDFSAADASDEARDETSTTVAGLIDRTETLLRDEGFTGEWQDAAPRRLDALRPPFLAPIELEGRVSMLVVRRIHSGFVFAFEPGVGDVLYPYDTFVRAWSGRVRTFDPRVPAPEAWR